MSEPSALAVRIAELTMKTRELETRTEKLELALHVHTTELERHAVKVRETLR
jgi:hypothetical protein